MTQAQALDWISKQVGKSLDYDKYYGSQCVDLVSYYCDFLGIPKKWGNARYWWEDSAYNGGGKLTKHTFNPQPGDIVVFKPASYNGNAGHIAIVYSVTPSSIRSLDQNWVNASLAGGSPAAWVDHPINSTIYGYLRPSFTNNTQGGIPMINDADNEYWRWNKLFYQIRGRNASRQEFKNAAVGRNWLTAMEILSDDGEADQATHAQNIGQIAVKDNWEGQIVGLVRDKTALTDQAKSLSEQIEIQKKEIEALKKQSGGISVEDSVAIKETNSIVKKLWEKISGIFK